MDGIESILKVQPSLDKIPLKPPWDKIPVKNYPVKITSNVIEEFSNPEPRKETPIVRSALTQKIYANNGLIINEYA